MRRVQLSGAADGPELLGGPEDAPKPFVLQDADFDHIERAAKIKLTATARNSLQRACETFLKLSRLATHKPAEAEVRSLLTSLEAGLKKTSSAFHNLAAPDEVSEAACIWLKRNWLENTPSDFSDFAISLELAHASVQKALQELSSIVVGAKGPEPNSYLSGFLSELESIYKRGGGRRTFQKFADAVLGALPRWASYKQSPDKRAKKQRLARAMR